MPSSHAPLLPHYVWAYYSEKDPYFLQYLLFVLDRQFWRFLQCLFHTRCLQIFINLFTCLCIFIHIARVHILIYANISQTMNISLLHLLTACRVRNSRNCDYYKRHTRMHSDWLVLKNVMTPRMPPIGRSTRRCCLQRPSIIGPGWKKPSRNTSKITLELFIS